MTEHREKNLGRFSNIKAITKFSENFLVYHYLVNDLASAIQKYAKGHVLDIGCGNKPYESLFQTKIDTYTGCDVVQSSLSKVDILCEATNIPVDDQTFDTVFSTQTIEHVYDHRMMVAEAWRALKEGGYFIVSGPMYWPLHEEPYDYFRFTKHGFRTLLENSGFEVEEIIPNGGKWALFGIVVLQTIPLIRNIKITKWILNSICLFLDKKFYDPVSTLNYVAIARKVYRPTP